MNARAWLVILVFLGWSAGSWYWYTCKIKGFCESGNSVSNVVPIDVKPPVNKAIEPQYGPLSFELNNSGVFPSDEWPMKLEDVANGQSEGKELTISGPYAMSEINATDYENLGIARAKGILALVSEKIDTSLVRIQSHVVDSEDVQQRERFEGVKFEWLTNTETVKEFKDGALIYFPYKSKQKINDPGIEAYLEQMVAALRENDQKVEIIGHTDDKGSAGYNEKLGQERADAIKAILVEKGIESGRIVALSMGESDPMVPNTTDENKAKNRRTEIKIKK